MTDYIKRADAIESVKNTILKRFNLADWYEEILNCGVEIEDTIKALPSADAVHGEWEDREVFNETDDDHIVEEWQSARCSVCGKYHTTPYMYYFDDFNFCPNCGARMKGGAE